ncbi:MAG: Hsp70 family protein [Actinobacteria bacterium]|nr:Hsp70 family protein [Actinomycetota bacterium]
MRYTIGVDLGTTYSAAAIGTPGDGGGRVDIATLGHSAAVVPSVVLVRDDGEILVGEAAERRAVTEPTRVAREFKRRLGDPTPIILGGTPYGAETLTAHLLRHVVRTVSQQRGAEPDVVVVTHPANYGPFKLDLMREATRLADVGEVEFLAEPEAAALHYAGQDRLDPGSVLAVYDFGGGTFDAAVLRTTETGFEMLGTPEGMERLGGIDFDQAILTFVRDALGGAIDELDRSEPTTANALARLREDCRRAKEALSTDTDADIPVILPNLHTEVRITRAEFESMIRPRVTETIESLGRAVRSTGLDMDAVTKVLLVGGTSRIPLVADMIGAETGRPVALDAHPKHAIPEGAAKAALGMLAEHPADSAVTAPASAEESAVATRQPLAPSDEGPGRRRWLVAGGVGAAVVLGSTALAVAGGGSDDESEGPSTTAAPSITAAPATTGPGVTTPSVPEGTVVFAGQFTKTPVDQYPARENRITLRLDTDTGTVSGDFTYGWNQDGSELTFSGPLKGTSGPGGAVTGTGGPEGKSTFETRFSKGDPEPPTGTITDDRGQTWEFLVTAGIPTGGS